MSQIVDEPVHNAQPDPPVAVGKTAVLILGMQRSGTSLLGGVLNCFGVALDSDARRARPEPGPSAGGYRDAASVHDEIFATLGISANDPLALPEGWLVDPRVQKLRAELGSIVERNFTQTQLWGIDDPRLCRLLPLWLDLLEELGIGARAVLVVRPPNDVAAALHKRERLDPDVAILSWLAHVLDSERFSRGLARTVVLYDDMLLNWEIEVQRMRAELDVGLFALSQERVSDITALLNGASDRRDAAMPLFRAPQNAAAKNVFEAMQGWRRNGTSPVEVCDRAADELRFAERAAAPIVAFARSAAQAKALARVDAQAEAFRKTRSLLEERLRSADEARAQAERSAADSALRQTAAEADAQALRSALAQAQADHEAARIERAAIEAELKLRTAEAETSGSFAHDNAASSREDRLHAELQTVREAQRRTAAELARAAQRGSELQTSLEVQTIARARASSQINDLNVALAQMTAQILRYRALVMQLRTELGRKPPSKSRFITKPVRRLLAAVRHRYRKRTPAIPRQ